MNRIFPLILCLAMLGLATTSPLRAQKPQEVQPPKSRQQEPPEEDESLAPKQYSFNPLQATKEVTIGNYYFKKGNFRAAAKRFTEATRWNPGYAEAFLRLGEAQEKLHDPDSANASFKRYLELAPDAKNADGVRKKLAHKE